MTTTAKRRYRPGKLEGYVLGVVTVIGGGVVARFIDPTAGAALVAAGAWGIGKIQKESLARKERTETPTPPPVPQP